MTTPYYEAVMVVAVCRGAKISPSFNIYIREYTGLYTRRDRLFLYFQCWEISNIYRLYSDSYSTYGDRKMLGS